MKVELDSQIKITDPTPEVLNYIKNELEINNPEIAKKQAMGFWTGNVPKKLKLYSKNEDSYVLPMGEIDNVWKLYPHKEDYTINFGKHKKLKYPKCNITPYDYQEKAIQYMINCKRGILESKCGSGKSITLLEIIARIGYKALIIVEKKEILNQFIDYLKSNYGMNKGEYGIIAEGKVEIGKYVTVALRQTLAIIDLTPLKYEFGTIAVDEGQNVGGSVTKCTQYSKILNNLASEYRYAVSATAYRVDGLTRAMYALLNNVKYRVPEEAIADKIIKAKIQPIKTKYKIPSSATKWDGTILYSELSNDLALNEDRNNFILKKLKENKNGYCLVLSDRLEGLRYLKDKLGQGVMIDGGMTSKKAKQERKDAIEKMRKNEEHYLFASYRACKRRA